MQITASQQYQSMWRRRWQDLDPNFK